MSVAEKPRKRGPDPGATRDEVLALARAHFLDCRRIDVQAIAAESGVGRATLYRWFGSRENLIGEAMLGVFEPRVADARAAVGGRGARALFDTFDLVYQGLAPAPHIRAFIDRERATALPLITSSEGPVHPRIVEIVRGLIDAEVERGEYQPPTESGTLAYVLVRLAEALLFNYETDDIPKDLVHLREVSAALLGLEPSRPSLPDSPLELIEFPADEPQRALRFWSGLLEVSLEPRGEGEGVGWESRSAGAAVGVHARGPGPGDTFSIPYFAVDDFPAALARVKELGGSVVHPGKSSAICKDSEGSPFGLTVSVR